MNERAAVEAPGNGRVLGLPELIAMGVGGMIGGGIFSVLGLAVDVSGHAAPFAFLSGSLIALVAGYSYIKLALAFRSDGASFTYLERAFPRTPWLAGIAGWTVVVGYIGTLALYAFTFGAYGSHLLGLDAAPGMRQVLSLAALLLFMAINLVGAGTMGRVEDVVVYLKVLLLALLGIVGFTTASAGRFVPLFDKGAPAVLLGGALIFVAYEGFQLITNAVLETRDPERNVPRGIYGSIIITSAIYLGIAIVATGNLDAGTLAEAREYALAVVAEPILGRTGVVLVDVAALLATSSAINATLFGSSRMASAMAVDALAPKVFSFRNHARVPWVGVVAITALAGVFTMLGGLELIAAFSSMTFLLVSIGVCLANLRLRAATGSLVFPVVLGLALMSLTVALLVLYLLEHDPRGLIVTAMIYAGTAASHGLFEAVRHRRLEQRTPADGT